MVSLQELSTWLKADDPEQRQIISGVSWERYEALLDDLGDSLRYRVTYLDGVLELVSPNRHHERNKTIVGSLLEDYLKEKRIRYFPLGSTTLRKKEKRGGAEPDESYCIGIEKEFPDLAIEVVLSSGMVDKLEIYRGLRVTEVWVWESGQFTIYHLRAEEYERITTSELLPDCDTGLLANYVKPEEQFDAVMAFREQLRTRSPG